MRRLTCLLLFLVLIGIVHLTPTRVTSKPEVKVATKKAWPHPIPLRVRDGANPDLMVMTLGDVTRNYFRDKLGVKYFKPIDKSIFPLPPSGWCTWYYYYQQINEVEVKRNAQWIADNLKDYGAQYVQIDDGWQGTGRVYTRDWTNVSDKYPRGMDKLA